MSIAKALEELRSSDPAVRIRAIGYLRAEPHCAPELINLLEDSDARARATAALILGQMGEGVESLILHLAGDPSSHVRLMCVSALRGQHPPCTEAFIAALGDVDESVAMTAASALGSAGDARAIPALQALVGQRSWGVRWHTCVSLYQLGATNDEVKATIESLRQESEAAAHDSMVSTIRQGHRDLGEPEPGAAYTTEELLKLVEEALATDA